MFEFWQGGNIYNPAPTYQQTGGVGGNINIPLPGGGSINVGGSTGGNNPVTMPPVYQPPVAQVGTGGTGLSSSNLMILVVVIIAAVLFIRK